MHEDKYFFSLGNSYFLGFLCFQISQFVFLLSWDNEYNYNYIFLFSQLEDYEVYRYLSNEYNYNYIFSLYLQDYEVCRYLSIARVWKEIVIIDQ